MLHICIPPSRSLLIPFGQRQLVRSFPLFTGSFSHPAFAFVLNLHHSSITSIMSGTPPRPLGGPNAVPRPNPLMVPPPGGWIDPSKVPMHHEAILLVGPITAFYLLDIAALALRIWARYIKKATWRLSDYAIFIAFLFGTGYIAICWFGMTSFTRNGPVWLFIVAILTLLISGRPCGYRLSYYSSCAS